MNAPPTPAGGSPLEGQLAIRLRTCDAEVTDVQIESTRQPGVSAVFQDKTVADALQMLPRLYSVCGVAQACAGVRACEQALGVSACEATEGLRNHLLTLETVREHLWLILLDWPVLLGETPQQMGMTDILALQRDYRQVVCSGANPFLPGVAVEAVDPARDLECLRMLGEILERSVFGVSPAQWLLFEEPETLRAWAAQGTTVAARMVHHVQGSGWQASGRCDSAPLEQQEAMSIGQSLQDDDFLRQPDVSGKCRETTAFTRTASPLLQHLQELHGKALLPRLVARLTEMAQLSQAIARPSAAWPCGQFGSGDAGFSWVTAARGQLMHSVRLVGEYVGDYSILAPTEWNFHPRGVAAAGLARLKGDRAAIERQAKLVINAIDPCVGYELVIN